MKKLKREKKSGFVRPPLRKVNRTPRNELCPCGSGKKYKRCCGMSSQKLLNKISDPNKTAENAGLNKEEAIKYKQLHLAAMAYQHAKFHEEDATELGNQMLQYSDEFARLSDENAEKCCDATNEA